MNENEISDLIVQAYTHQKNGQLSQAIELLDQATAYKEAGLAVLLNAIQVKITYMDQRAASREMLDDVDHEHHRPYLDVEAVSSSSSAAVFHLMIVNSVY